MAAVTIPYATPALLALMPPPYSALESGWLFLVQHPSGFELFALAANALAIQPTRQTIGEGDAPGETGSVPGRPWNGYASPIIS